MYQDLVKEIYESTEFDPNIFDLELSYKPKVAVKMMPISIKNDNDMIVFILEQNLNIEYGVPLYVILVKKKNKKDGNDKAGGEAVNVKLDNYDDNDDNNNNDEEDGEDEDEVDDDDDTDDDEEDGDNDDDSDNDVNEK